MAAPSKTFTTIDDTRIDIDSPLNTELFTFLRDNIVHLDERVGIPSSAGARQANHAHLGLGVDGTAIIGVGNTSIPWLADPVTLVSGGNATVFTDVDVSASIVPEAVDMDIEWLDAPSTLNDKTSAARLNDAVNTGAVMDSSDDFLYIGANETFIKILMDLATFAVGAGALTVEFFNGTAFAAVAGLTDGTESGGNTFAQNGNVTFTLPTTWATGAQVVQAGLNASLFYVRFKFANTPSTAPNIDQAAPKPFTAKLVFLQCRIDASSSLRIDLALRRNGSSSVTPNIPQLRREDATAATPEVHGMLFVGLDANEIFEFKTIQSANSIEIVLVGFIR